MNKFVSTLLFTAGIFLVTYNPAQAQQFDQMVAYTTQVGDSSVQIYRYSLSDRISSGTTRNAKVQLRVFSSNPNLKFSNIQPQNDNYRMSNPVIITQGFDPDWYDPSKRFDWTSFSQMLITSDTRESVIGKLISNKYDVVLALFDSTNISINSNALAMSQAFKWVQDRTRSNQNINIIGPSMGGLICRTALQTIGGTLKKRVGSNTVIADDIRVGLFVAFDSPNWGAVIPMSVQATVGYFYSKNDAADISNKSLFSEAAGQMLLYRRKGRSGSSTSQNINGYLNPEANSESNTSARSFFGSLNNPYNVANLINLKRNRIGDRVGTMHTLAIANGTIQKDQNVLRGADIYKVDRATLYTRVSSHNANTSTKIGMFDALDMYEWAYYLKEPVMLEDMPGGTRTSYGQVFNALVNSSAAGGTIYNNANTWKHAFVPTASALGVDMYEIRSNFNIEGLWMNPLGSGRKSIFNYSYYPETNQNHVELTSENVSWILFHLGLSKL
jgi:hypothetical protein